MKEEDRITFLSIQNGNWMDSIFSSKEFITQGIVNFIELKYIIYIIHSITNCFMNVYFSAYINYTSMPVCNVNAIQ